MGWGSTINQLAGAGRDTTAITWSLATGKPVRISRGHTRRIECVVWSHDDSKLATGSQDKTTRVWDSETGKVLSTLSGFTHPVRGVAWNPFLLSFLQYATASSQVTTFAA